MFPVEIKTNPWLDKGIILMTDRNDNVVGVFTTREYNWLKFMRILNMGGDND